MKGGRYNVVTSQKPKRVGEAFIMRSGKFIAKVYKEVPNAFAFAQHVCDMLNNNMRAAEKREILLQWQGRVEGTVRAFEVNGMLAVPCQDGVAYVSREDAKAFFGFADVDTDAVLAKLREGLGPDGSIYQEVEVLLNG